MPDSSGYLEEQICGCSRWQQLSSMLRLVLWWLIEQAALVGFAPVLLPPVHLATSRGAKNPCVAW